MPCWRWIRTLARIARCRGGSSSMMRREVGRRIGEDLVGVHAPQGTTEMRYAQPATSRTPSSKPGTASPTPRRAPSRMPPRARMASSTATSPGTAEEGDPQHRADQRGDRQPAGLDPVRARPAAPTARSRIRPSGPIVTAPAAARCGSPAADIGIARSSSAAVIKRTGSDRFVSISGRRDGAGIRAAPPPGLPARLVMHRPARLADGDRVAHRHVDGTVGASHARLARRGDQRSPDRRAQVSLPPPCAPRSSAPPISDHARTARTPPIKIEYKTEITIAEYPMTR